MKLHTYAAFLVAFLSASPLVFAQSARTGYLGVNVTFTVRPDGSCELTDEWVETRAQIEQQTLAFVRYVQSMQDYNGETPSPAAKTNDLKSLSNDELAAKLRGLYQQAGDLNGAETQLVVEVSFPSTNEARLALSYKAASLDELAGEIANDWTHQMSSSVVTIRFETDTNNHLRVTTSGGNYGAAYVKQLWKSYHDAGIRAERRIILPGKILSSTEPNTKDNVTWDSFDAKDTNSLNAAVASFNSNTVIIAELGGLKLDHPVDFGAVRRGATKTYDIPVTDAGPGFVAEAQSVATTTLYNFPGATNKESNAYRNANLQRTQINAKLFAPKGRILLSASTVHVKLAIDDKGRSLLATNANTAEPGDYETPVVSYGSNKRDTADIYVALAVPQPDAQSIKQVDAEMTTVTAGSFKAMQLANVSAGTNVSLDLGEVLPGATLTVRKISARNGSIDTQIELKGPPDIRKLELELNLPKSPDNEMAPQSNTSEMRFQKKGDKSSRLLHLYAYIFNPGGAAPSTNSVSLQVRLPQDIKHERVKFTLNALDIY